MTSNTLKTSASLAVVLALLGATPIAHADCLTPEAVLLWSYPADGDVDVPTNAELWFLSNLASLAPQTTVTLNGKSVPAAPAGPNAGQISSASLRFLPGELTANTQYTAELKYAPTGSQPERTFELRFTTGAGPAKAGKGAQVTARFAEAPELNQSEPCRELTSAQGCFDTVEAEPPRVHRFALKSSDAIAWFVRAEQPDGSMLWPAACGAPRLFLRTAKPDECFFVQAISRGGLLEPETRHCEKASTKKPEPPASVVGLKPMQPKPAPVVAAPPPAPAPAALEAPPAEPPPAAPTPESKPGLCAATYPGDFPRTRQLGLGLAFGLLFVMFASRSGRRRAR